MAEIGSMPRLSPPSLVLQWVGVVVAIRRAVGNGKPSIINVEVDQVSLSPLIAGYAKSLQPSE